MTFSQVAESIDPTRTQPLVFRVAGHKTILQDESRFLKFIYEDRYNAWWETQFYEKIAPELPGLHSLLPKYLGTATMEGTDSAAKYLALEHLTLKYKNAVVLDMKIGTQSYDYDANEAKIKKEVAKFDKQEALGIRVSGARMHCREKGELVYNIQEDLAHVTPDTFTQEIIGRFLFDGKHYRTKTGQIIKKRIEELYKWFETENNKYRFFGSSALLMYDADAPDGERVDFWFIDHAHVQPFRNGETKDVGVMRGLKNILTSIDEVCLADAPHVVDM
jgi:hypothetical protein